MNTQHQNQCQHRGQVGERLSERDWQILGSIHEHRYLTTRQLARLHFGLEASEQGIPRRATLALSRLRSLGLTQNLERRIGGVRAGSAGLVWSLTEQASRLLARKRGEPVTRRLREYEPSPAFLEHTLAVAEVVIELTDAAQHRDVTLSRIELEPAAWRRYLNPHGVTVWLKPDLAAITATEGFEDAWFIEVDRATESLARIVKKCFQYQDYWRTGREQTKLGVFPAVVWIVPNTKRRNQLRERITTEHATDGRLFTVITLNELGQLIGLGAAEFTNQSGGQEGETTP